MTEHKMKIKGLKQGSDEWKEYRKTKIMATDAAVLMNVSPYMTPLQLWRQKKGLIPEPIINSAMARGSALEAEALAWACKELKMELFPQVIEHENGWAAASLDGVNFEEAALIEIKCPGERVYGEISSGIIPPHWNAQMQHQMFVTGLHVACLAVYSGSEGILRPIIRDETFIQELAQKGLEFWNLLESNQEPAPTEKDYVSIIATEYQKKLISHWSDVNDQLKFLTKMEKDYRDQICDLGDDGNAFIYDSNGYRLLRMSRISREGNVDWKTLCKEKNITEDDIQKYRKESIGFYKLSKANE